MHAGFMFEIREWRVVGSQNIGWKIFSSYASFANYCAGNEVWFAESKCSPGHEAFRHSLFTRRQPGVHDYKASKAFRMLRCKRQTNESAPVLTNKSYFSQIESFDKRFDR